MGEKTEIGWTDATFNPWWGCQRVSPGCEHCYAETFAKRYGRDIWGPTTARRMFGDAHWNEPVKWDRGSAQDLERGATHRRRVFCASMADVFEVRDDLIEPRDRLFRLIAATPNLDWLVLTKRPREMLEYIEEQRDARAGHKIDPWPLPNLWLGTTVENQAAADERIPLLLQTPAAVRFLSCEPLLGPVDLRGWIEPPAAYKPLEIADTIKSIDWVIVGGESGGPEERRLVTHLGNRNTGEIWTPTREALGWVRAIKQQCLDAEVPLFLKQWGGPTPKSGGRLLDGRTWDQFPSSPVKA